MDNRFYLVVSITLSICIYILIILIVLFYLKPIEDKEVFSGFKNEFLIELDIVNDSAEIVEQKGSSQELIESQSAINDSKDTVTSKSSLDVKSIFSNIKSETLNPKISSKVDPALINTNKKFESKIQKDTSINNIELSKLLDIESPKSRSANLSLLQGKIDSYYSQISSLILSRWYRFPLTTDAKYLVSANIKIDTAGNFSFVMLKYSGNNHVDEAVKLFLKNQSLETYPVSPDRMTKIIKINFMPYSE